MNETDNIFDLSDFIKKHGDKSIKKTWKEHLDWHYQLDRNDSKYRQLMFGLSEIKRVLLESDKDGNI